MAEKIVKAKLRVEKIQCAEPITEEGQLASVAWQDLPLTLRDDVLEITEAGPEEEVVKSHENDTDEELEVSGGGITAKGSFIRATRDQLIELFGGKKTGSDDTERFQKSSKKKRINKALKFTLRGGGDVIVPNAEGYVLLNLGLGQGSTTKYPFTFKCKKASPAWDCDIIY